ncbi:cytochrome c oxidase assembly protein [Tessaracoccus antarcticus]|uniref:Cytochrome c oxidase assembly protein n=1 Tax=Tessaracoccus antarcticus TaxID=2479848 RepID=A0A3M0GQT4_9ACTN|nr:cytochrome c oxidase assembly protein [Tessaracoccus antarcticus]RMB59646.1 cytochrome c oxidase assembly protein [Tessaracoccus antarcticus]
MFGGLTLPGFLPLHADPGDDVIPLEGWRYLTAWTFEPVPLVMILLTAGLYLYGVHVLHKRGDTWPVLRTVYFVVLGLGTLSVALFSFLGTYDTVMFWLHMVQHMMLNMIAPVFLVAGAPMTLALRTLPKRPRKWLLVALHSTVAKIALFPPLTTFLMIASPFALYMTGWYNLTLRNNVAHDMLHIYMVVVGCLFFFPLLGVDPVPIRMPYPIRILLFFLTMPFHAFLGVTIMGSTRLIAEDWYLAFNRTWGFSPLEDQTWAGGLMWATGDITMFAAMFTIFLQWIKDSKREAKRVDRALDRRDALAAKQAAMAREGGVGYDAGRRQPPARSDADTVGDEEQP